eukprot:CAMPEP_0119141420 /NCGR_PEP_ID=MMETSP1310-20130426/31001_1 /TAXON_ID=464262 /ORGANISM="Genus nov. species nov., Strain RCC2339" /LENGTH=194 /DNA_ID=CAMNT_0007132871 /DNA_START=86 /DNA_END=671 /DNA_ORIENTATION=+
MADTEEKKEEIQETEAAAEQPAQDEATAEEDDDPEVAEMKRKVKEMEEEAARIEQMQKEAESAASSSATSAADSDARSVYVGNVDYGATAEELQAHFQSCGSITRLTIMTDKWTGHPKGFAYVEFSDKEAIENAVALNDPFFEADNLRSQQNEPTCRDTGEAEAADEDIVDMGDEGGGGGMGATTRTNNFSLFT